MSQPVTDEQIQQVVDYAQKVINTYYAQEGYENIKPGIISVEKGKRYAKLLITQDGGKGQRFCYGFIDMTNGDLFKAASFKAPERNFPRGNIHTNDLACCKPHSLR